jgi:hypothetical protein
MGGTKEADEKRREKRREEEREEPPSTLNLLRASLSPHLSP